LTPVAKTALSILTAAVGVLGGDLGIAKGQQDAPRMRVRQLGLEVGVLPPGPLNAITDVEGVLVGHATVVEGDSIRTGVTVIRPHSGDVFLEKVPAAIYVANGFGKLTGVTQVDELGTLETPVVLTNTLAVGRVADALVRWTLDTTDDPAVRSVNPVVAETNDGFLNAIRVPRIGSAEVESALAAAGAGPVVEGSVGAGTGTRALGFKGGIGTASRRVRIGDEVYTLGALVQSNFGGALEIKGVLVGQRLGAADFIERWLPTDTQTIGRDPNTDPVTHRLTDEPDSDGGSIVIVIATDAPVGADALMRIARRAPYAIGRVGGFSSHGSGDYVIAFSTHPQQRVLYHADKTMTTRKSLRSEALSPLFLAAIEASEEAILNSLFQATTVTGHRGTAPALPLDRVRDMLEQANRLNPQR
jgi:D-aminopeptidase